MLLASDNNIQYSVCFALNSMYYFAYNINVGKLSEN